MDIWIRDPETGFTKQMEVAEISCKTFSRWMIGISLLLFIAIGTNAWYAYQAYALVKVNPMVCVTVHSCYDVEPYPANGTLGTLLVPKVKTTEPALGAAKSDQTPQKSGVDRND